MKTSDPSNFLNSKNNSKSSIWNRVLIIVFCILIGLTVIGGLCYAYRRELSQKFGRRRKTIPKSDHERDGAIEEIV